MFKILWNDGTTSPLNFPTVDRAISFGGCTGEDFKVIDQNKQVVEEYWPLGQGFVNVGGMTYDQVRRMNRE